MLLRTPRARANDSDVCVAGRGRVVFLMMVYAYACFLPPPSAPTQLTPPPPPPALSATHNIGWVAWPPHEVGGAERKGGVKKASITMRWRWLGGEFSVERVGGEEVRDAVFESRIWSRGRWGQLRRRAGNGKRCRIGRLFCR
jgi:hypothetical protein